MILISGILETISSLKDKTIKLTFSLNELSPEKIGEVWQCLNQFVYLGLKVEPFKQEEEKLIDSLEADLEVTGKSPGQRLRNVLYRRYENKKEGFKTFQQYYDYRMEQMIEYHKAKIDD